MEIMISDTEMLSTRPRNYPINPKAMKKKLTIPV
jgi:hypothetical protein